MPRGLTSEARPVDVVGCAVKVAKIVTGEIEANFTYGLTPGRKKSGKTGGRKRALKLTGEERREIAKKAAEADWR